MCILYTYASMKRKGCEHSNRSKLFFGKNMSSADSARECSRPIKTANSLQVCDTKAFNTRVNREQCDFRPLPNTSNFFFSGEGLLESCFFLGGSLLFVLKKNIFHFPLFSELIEPYAQQYNVQY